MQALDVQKARHRRPEQRAAPQKKLFYITVSIFFLQNFLRFQSRPGRDSRLPETPQHLRPGKSADSELPPGKDRTCLLVSRVVDIEFTLYLITGGVENCGEGVAQDPAAGIANVHGTRGIGRNIFHQHPLSLPEIAVSVLFASTVYLLQYSP